MPSPPAGPIFWYKADAGVTKDGSNRVSAWADQSGNGYDVSNAASTSHQPLWTAAAINGLPALDWGQNIAGDSTSDKYLQRAIGGGDAAPIKTMGARTIVALIKTDQWSGDPTIVGGDVVSLDSSFNFQAQVLTVSGRQQAAYDGGYYWQIDTPVDYKGQWIVVAWQWAGVGSTSVNFYVNGVLKTGSFPGGNILRTVGNITRINVGFDNGTGYTGPTFSGMIAEVICYDNVDALATTATVSYMMGRAGLAPPPFPGLKTTASYIADPSATFSPFYYLKISGLPYYFGSIVDPTDAKWGAYQWTLPAGYTWKKGMDIPDTQFDQSIPDMIGGIASAERCTLSMMDFPVTDANGSYSFFGRLLSPGRITTNTSAVLGTLTQSIDAGSNTPVISVKGVNGAFAGNGDTFIGGETFAASSVSGPDANLVYTVGTSARNLYPCNANYPPRSTFVVPVDDSGNVDDANAPQVTQGAPLSFLYRTCALYIGHMTPDGNPDIEANATCRMIGRIKSVNYGREPGKFSFDIESIMADLSTARVAPGLARAGVYPAIHLEVQDFRQIYVYVSGMLTSGDVATKGHLFTVDNGLGNLYSGAVAAADLARAINAQFSVSPLALGFTGGTRTVTLACAVVPDSDGPKFMLTATPSKTDFSFSVTYSPPTTTVPVPGARASLLRPLGFSANAWAASDSGSGNIARVTSPQVVPALFIPTEITGAGTTFTIIPDKAGNSSRWNTDQGDGSGTGYIRFSTGVVATLLSSAANTLTLGASGTSTVVKGGAVYVPFQGGDPLTVEQIVRVPSHAAGSNEKAIGQLLASKGYATDGEFNVFAAGVGLGFNGIMDKESFRSASQTSLENFQFDVDTSTAFMDLWTPLAKERGAFLVWDVANCQISLRTITIPNYASSSIFQFTESNRTATGERSQAAFDTSNIRTGWTIRYGWDAKTKKFLGGEINIINDRAINTFQVASRVETIEDKIIPAGFGGPFVAGLAGSLVDRFDKLSYPWTKVTRNVNKTALLLAPGTYHKIIDATVFNHFTGIQGIAASDNVYGWLMSVKSTLKTGTVTATFLIDQQTDGTTLRPWSPTGRLNFSAGGGYNNATGVCTMDVFYTSQAGKYDGIDFQVGDKVYLQALDNPTGTPAFAYATTISAISTDGLSVTVASGLSGGALTVEAILILQNWGAQTTDRKTGDHRTAFQGDGNALLIAGAARLHKWS